MQGHYFSILGIKHPFENLTKMTVKTAVFNIKRCILNKFLMLKSKESFFIVLNLTVNFSKKFNQKNPVTNHGIFFRSMGIRFPLFFRRVFFDCCFFDCCFLRRRFLRCSFFWFFFKSIFILRGNPLFNFF